MPKVKAKLKKPKFLPEEKVYFRKANGEWGDGIVHEITSNFKGNRYFIRTKYMKQVFGEEYLFAEKEYKKLVKITPGKKNA